MDTDSATADTEGLLAIWHDVAPGAEGRIRDWYNQEHHVERLAVPGFLSAHRYERRRGNGGEILCLYRTASPVVLSSAPYLSRLAEPSERTQCAMPQFRRMCRTSTRLVAQTGNATGGALAVLAGQWRLVTQEEMRKRIRIALNQEISRTGVLRCRWVEGASRPSEAQPSRNEASAEALLRGCEDREVDWALLVDANRTDDAIQAVEEIAGRAGLPVCDRSTDEIRGEYELVYVGGYA